MDICKQKLEVAMKYHGEKVITSRKPAQRRTKCLMGKAF